MRVNQGATQYRQDCSARTRCVFSRLCAASHEPELRRLSLPKGAFLFHQAAPCAAMYVLCRGAVRLVCHGAAGRSVLLGFRRPGDVLAVPVGQPHACSALARQDVTVLVATSAALRELLADRTELALGLVAHLAHEEARYVQRAADLARRRASERLARAIVDITAEADDQAGDCTSIPDRLSVQDIADLAACSRQTASTWLHKMETSGVIARSRGRLKIVEPERLRELCG